MLNKEHILQLINNPSYIDEENTEELQKLITQYPFAQTLHLLYLKGLRNTGSIKYENQLPITSIQSPNREILYNLTIQENFIKKIEQELSEEKETTKEAKSSEIILKESTPEEHISTSEIELDKNTSSNEVKEIEESILQEVATYSIAEISTKNENTPIIEEKPIKTNSKQSFNNWLNPKKSIQKEDIIERFIKENPTISKNKAELYSAPNLAKMSVVDNEDFVTETLARVYLKQGHYDKAIRTYQKLSLKNPEKKVFFASQIEVIKELKKQE